MVKVSSAGAPLEWQRFAAIIVFLLAAASDGLDGYVARRYKQRSALGAILDPIADKGLLLSGIITLSITNWSQSDPNYGKFPVWFPVLVITRDAVILVGAAILHYFIGNKMKVKPSWTGKVATGLSDVRDRVGHVAVAISAVVVCRDRSGNLHRRFRV
jgi:phosphatidylglycerophosphate synthase